MASSKHSVCEVAVLKLSKAAALCVFDDEDNTELWVPYSLIENPEDLDEAAGKCEIGIEKWFLRKHDLLDE